MAWREVVAGIHAADEAVQIRDLRFGTHPLLGTGRPAHLLCLQESLAPAVDVFWPRAVGSNRHSVHVNVDMSLESTRTLGVGDHDRIGPVPVLVRGKADDVSWI